MTLNIELIACLSDNYAILLRDSQSGKVACIDSPDASVIAKAIDKMGWGRLDYIFNTHWHPDHAGGNQALKDVYQCEIYGPQEVKKIAPLDHIVSAGDVVSLGETHLNILDLSGHTNQMIGYFDAHSQSAFVGDCLFNLGCGRLFEGSAHMMWKALQTLCALDDETLIYCAHEYTLANLDFAQTVAGIRGAPPKLPQRAIDIKALRDKNLPTVPMRLGDEKQTNPFLYYPLLEHDTDKQLEVFTQLRLQKDRF